MCDMTHSYVWHDSFPCMTLRIVVIAGVESRVFHKKEKQSSPVRVCLCLCSVYPCLIRVCDMAIVVIAGVESRVCSRQRDCRDIARIHSPRHFFSCFPPKQTFNITCIECVIGCRDCRCGKQSMRPTKRLSWYCADSLSAPLFFLFPAKQKFNITCIECVIGCCDCRCGKQSMRPTKRRCTCKLRRYICVYVYLFVFYSLSLWRFHRVRGWYAEYAANKEKVEVQVAQYMHACLFFIIFYSLSVWRFHWVRGWYAEYASCASTSIYIYMYISFFTHRLCDNANEFVGDMQSIQPTTRKGRCTLRKYIYIYIYMYFIFYAWRLWRFYWVRGWYAEYTADNEKVGMQVAQVHLRLSVHTYIYAQKGVLKDDL